MTDLDSQNDRLRSLWQALGPGLIFAGTAVGVSHLVQSTRAGAGFGLGLLVVVIFANLIKYPTFSFGPRYAAATGTSLLEGYRQQGRWALWLYFLVTVGTMFFVQAAVTLLTVGIFCFLFDVPPQHLIWAAIATTLTCVGLLAIGRYLWLEFLIKVFVAVLVLCIVLCTALVLPRVQWSSFSLLPEGVLGDTQSTLFLVGLIGWMPCAFDVTIWSSIWTLEKQKQRKGNLKLRSLMLDFKVSYIGCALLAICFVVLGAGLFHQADVKLETSPVAFAGQIVGIFSIELGGWIKPVIAAAVLATMVSTTLAVVDGFPRALGVLSERFSGEEKRDTSYTKRFTIVRWVSMGIISAGALFIIWRLQSSLKAMVDIATVLSFLTAPALAFLNHRAMFSNAVPEDAKPGKRIWGLSWGAIFFSLVFSVWFLVVFIGF